MPVIFYLAGGFVTYKIGEAIGFGFKKAKLLMFVYLTTPIAFFSPVIFGQYDSFTVFFVLLGTYFYFKNDALKFTLFFAVAMTFKYFALLIFLPLLLLREKKVLKIFLHCILFSLPFALEAAFYIWSKNFKVGVLGFKAANYLFKGEINLFYIHPSIFLILWVFLLFWAYYKKFDESENKEDFVKWAIYFCNIVVFLTFGLSMWHPQWLIFMVPFVVLGSMINKNAKTFLMVDIVMFLVFIILCLNLWRGSVDESLMSKGILKTIIDYNTQITVEMKELFFLSGVDVSNLLFGCFSGLLLSGAVFKHPAFSAKRLNEAICCNFVLRLRMASILIFWVIPAFFCVIKSKYDGVEYFVKNSNFLLYDGSVGVLTKGRQIQQNFKIPDTISKIEQIRVSFTTEDKIYDGILEVSIKDLTNDVVLFKEEYETIKFKHVVPTKLDVGEIDVSSNNLYCLNKKKKKPDNKNIISINKTKNFDDEKYRQLREYGNVFGGELVVCDGEKKQFNLCLDILGS